MGHKLHPDGYWTRERIFEESHKYEKLEDFHKGAPTAHSVAQKNKWLGEMTWLKRKTMWTNEMLMAEGRKYKTKTAFKMGNAGAYGAAYKRGLLNEMTWLDNGFKPAGFWQIKENVIEESKKYTTRSQFNHGASAAYASAVKHGWIEEMTWLVNPHKEKGYWTEERVREAAKECESISEFHERFSSAYNAARKMGIRNDLGFKPKQVYQGKLKEEPVHLIYVYLDKIYMAAYVGATKQLKKRHCAHRNKRDKVCKYFMSVGQSVPNPIILKDGLYPVERQEEERNFSLFYQANGFRLLNKINLTGVGIGSLGGGYLKWSQEEVMKTAQKFERITDFMVQEAGAYNAAKKFGLLNMDDMPWFFENRKPFGWWNVKEHVFVESKKYNSWHEFEIGTPAACNSARKHKWAKEMTWLANDQMPQGYWQVEEHVITESLKYTNRTDFRKGCSAGYNYANELNLWEKMPWIELKAKPNGTWNDRETVFAEGRKYRTRMEFKKGSPSAYGSATRHGWINEMDWLEQKSKPAGFWSVKENVMAEGRKYSSRVDFRWGASAAYHSAIEHGWIEEMTWLKRPANYNLKWTKESVFEAAKPFKTRSQFKTAFPGAYKVAREKGWLEEMTWLTSIFKKN